MQFKRYFFLFFILFLSITDFTYAGKSDSNKLFNQYLTYAKSQWDQSNALISSCSQLPEKTIAEKIAIFEKAIACCQLAINQYNAILNHKDGKKDRAKPIRTNCRDNIFICTQHINYIRTLIDYIKIFDDLIEKIVQGNSLRQQDSFPTLSEIPQTIMKLESAKQLYEEALQLCERILVLIAPFPLHADKSRLRNMIADLEITVKDCTKDITEWRKASSEKQLLTEYLAKLKEKSSSLQTEEDLQHCCNLHKQMEAILQTLIKCGENCSNELKSLENCISDFEVQINQNQSDNVIEALSQEDFWKREELRRENFFRYLPLDHSSSGSACDLSIYADFSSCLKLENYPIVVPLDGQSGTVVDPITSGVKEYSLYDWQPHRFLIQHNSSASNLSVKVYKDNRLVHEEKVSIPLQDTEEWSRYLVDGMVISPNTPLRKHYGLNLRLMITPDPDHQFSMTIVQKGSIIGYRYVMSLEDTPLYQFHYTESPPWQLEYVRKPHLHGIEKAMDTSYSTISFVGNSVLNDQTTSCQVLKDFVEELNRDPIAIAQYVYNEIDLIDPFLLTDSGSFHPPIIHRSPYGTFLEKQGSPWEQCTLLVELLRLAGHQARFVYNGTCFLPHSFAEKMLFTQIPECNQVSFKYPSLKEQALLFVLILDAQVQRSLQCLLRSLNRVRCKRIESIPFFHLLE